MVTRFLTTLFIICAVQGCGLQTQTSTATIRISGETFHLEIACDDASRALGFMHRTEIPSDGGMLFIFPDSIIRSFWMKNCLVPIDILFLDSRGTITATHEMPVERPRKENESEWAYDSTLSHYWSNTPARFAIELKTGSIARLGLRVNERISLDIPTLRTLAR